MILRMMEVFQWSTTMKCMYFAAVQPSLRLETWNMRRFHAGHWSLPWFPFREQSPGPIFGPRITHHTGSYWLMRAYWTSPVKTTTQAIRKKHMTIELIMKKPSRFQQSSMLDKVSDDWTYLKHTSQLMCRFRPSVTIGRPNLDRSAMASGAPLLAPNEPNEPNEPKPNSSDDVVFWELLSSHFITRRPKFLGGEVGHAPFKGSYQQWRLYGNVTGKINLGQWIC